MHHPLKDRGASVLLQLNENIDARHDFPVNWRPGHDSSAIRDNQFISRHRAF
jgi:hypothetical protein